MGRSSSDLLGVILPFSGENVAVFIAPHAAGLVGPFGLAGLIKSAFLNGALLSFFTGREKLAIKDTSLGLALAPVHKPIGGSSGEFFVSMEGKRSFSCDVSAHLVGFGLVLVPLSGDTQHLPPVLKPVNEKNQMGEDLFSRGLAGGLGELLCLARNVGGKDRPQPLRRATAANPRMGGSHRASKASGKFCSSKGKAFVPGHGWNIHGKIKNAMRKIKLVKSYAMRKGNAVNQHH